MQPVTAWDSLGKALEEVAFAKSCIADNRGPDKELARESYENCLAESLLPAMRGALEALDDKALVSIARQMHKKLEVA